MGVPAEERKRGERAEAAGEAGQRGETDSRRIETKRKIYPLPSHDTVYAKIKIKIITVEHLTSCECFCKMCFCFVNVLKFSLTEGHKQPSYSLTKMHSKRKTLSSHSKDVSFTLCGKLGQKSGLLNPSNSLCPSALVNVVLTHNDRHASVC